MLLTRQQAYKQTVRIKAKDTLINLKIKDIERLINIAINNGEFSVFYSISVSSIVYDTIANILIDKEFDIKKNLSSHDQGIFIYWNSDYIYSDK